MHETMDLEHWKQRREEMLRDGELQDQNVAGNSVMDERAMAMVMTNHTGREEGSVFRIGSTATSSAHRTAGHATQEPKQGG
jgi:hypothetical protein